MHLFSLISALKSLDETSFRRFGEYVRSPYFKVPAASVVLFEYLEQCYPDFTESKIQPEIIDREPLDLRNTGKQRKAGSELLRAFENFIAMEDCMSNEMEKGLHMLNGLKNLHLFEQFDEEYAVLRDEIKTDPDQGVDAFFYRHQVAEISFNVFDAGLQRKKQNDLIELLNTLDEYYSLKKIRYLCEAISRKNILGLDYGKHQTDVLLEKLQPYNSEQHPYVHLFIHVFNMVSATTYKDAEVPYLFIKQFANNYAGNKLSDAYFESTHYAANWCHYWRVRGYGNAGHEFLWWIDYKIKWNILMEKNKLQPITFRNVLIQGIASDKGPAWMLRFINDYGGKLPEEHRETTVAFGMGLYNFVSKNYSTAVRCFLEAQAKEEIAFNGMIRQWQWIATYEASPQDTDTLLNQLLAFEKYILRNKAEFDRVKVPFNTFIAYSKKLVSINATDERLAALEALKSENHFPGREWFLCQFTRSKQKVRFPGEWTFA
jgi:hypothetical protein